MSEIKTLSDLTYFLKKRTQTIILCAVPVFIISVIVAYVLPPIFVAKSTILIESQEIPQEYVKATVTSYVEERLQSITQQIMSRSKLLDIIKRFNLYPEMRKQYATEIVLEKMRKDIKLDTITTGRRRNDSTIAFILSYEGKDPVVVQKVANVLASMYLEANIEKREAQASRTAEFLQRESNRLKEQVENYATQISTFKQQHLGKLPENTPNNIRMLEELNRDMDQITMQLRSLHERRTYLEGQMANIDFSQATISEEPGAASSPEERLNYYRQQLSVLLSSYSEKHPDVIKLKRQISDLEKQISSASKQDSSQKKSDSSTVDLRSTNPLYINLVNQINAIAMEQNVILAERQSIRNKVSEYQEKIEKAPIVEKQYLELTRDYEHVKNKYNEIMTKLLEARVAEGMEETQHGERFTIIEPAETPGAPEKPDRKKIMLIGLFLALGSGIGLAFLQESLDRSIKTAVDLKAIANIPVLSSIPLIETPGEHSKKIKLYFLIAILALVVIAAGLFVIHFAYMPLDILLLKLQRTIMIKL